MAEKIPSNLRIGTRGSPLAMAQTRLLIDCIREAYPDYLADGGIEIVTIKASGDYDPLSGSEEYLRDRGGKGLFTKELEEALLQNHIDIAVHSMKDVPTWLPQGLKIAAVLPRGEVRDALICHCAPTLEALPMNALIGTSSLRRQAQLINLRDDYVVVPFRGNVDTRLKKLEANSVQGIVLAACGLQRLKLDKHITALLDVETMLPSAAQGIVGIEIREKDDAIAQMLAPISCADTMLALETERAMLEVLDGSCTTPIGGLAEISGQGIRLRGLVANPKAKGIWRASGEATRSDGRALGQDIGRQLRMQVPAGILPGA